MQLKNITYYTLIVALAFNLALQSQNSDLLNTLDSIQQLRQLAKNKDLGKNTRLLHAKNAVALSKKTTIDSVIFNSNNTLADTYWDLRLFEDYRDFNKNNLELAKQTKDSVTLGKAYLNLGEYYRKKTIYSDSAFYHYHKARKTYHKLDDNYGEAYAIYGIAVIKKDNHFLIESEKDCFLSFKLLDKTQQNHKNIKLKAFLFNNLGAINYHLDEFSKATAYFNKALKIKKKLKGDNTITTLISVNNLALAFKKAKQYDLAIEHLKIVLDNKKIINAAPHVYVTSLDNYAHTLYLSKKHEQLPYLYHKALNIADTTNATYESIVVNHHLAEYYHDYKQLDSSKYYAYKAKALSETYYNDDLLNSLLLLSKIEDDSIAVKHYDAYIKLNDSLLKQERALRNKFARIEYETDNYIDENKRLTNQNLLIAAIAAIIILIMVLLYIIRLQLSKNEKLKLEQAQQKANEEIYSLMLREQSRVEEGRLQERYRISEELHDGILNQLLGARLGLEFISYEEDSKNKEKYQVYLNEIKNIEKEIRDLSHTLKNTALVANKEFNTIIKEYVDTQSQRHHFGYEIHSNSTIVWNDINDIIKVNLFRIIQEAIQNVVKHAKANLITLKFSLQGNKLHVTISDNGVGFDNTKKEISTGIGLKNIASRATKLNGKLKIDSQPDKGTSLEILVPIN